MKKSRLYFTTAIFIWVLGITYQMFDLFGPKKFIAFNKNIFTNFFPFIGFVFIFIGIFIARKGSQFYNIEQGRAANYRPPLTKVQKTTFWVIPVCFTIITVIVVAVTLSGK